MKNGIIYMQSSHPGSGRYSSLKYILLQHIYSVAWITCETGENSQTSGTSETNEFMNVVKHWVKMKLIVWMMTEITLFRAKDDWMIMTIMKMLWQKVCGDSSSTTRSWALRWEKGSCEGAVSLVHCHPSTLVHYHHLHTVGLGAGAVGGGKELE